MKAERGEGSGRPHVGVHHQETPSGCFVKLFSNWGARCGSEGKKGGGGGGGANWQGAKTTMTRWNRRLF